MKRVTLLAAVLALTLAGCQPPSEGGPAALAVTVPPPPTILTVMTHDSFSISAAVLMEFERDHNAKVRFVKSGDAGTMLNKAILAKGNPVADVLYGIDNTYLSRALQEGILEAYDSPLLDSIPDKLRLDTENRAIPIDYGDVCLNYDKGYFAEKGIAPPDSLDDLTAPAYKGLTVVENPSTSSPGLAFLLTTVGVFGDPGYLDYWRDLAANDVLVVDGWDAAYYTEFSASAGHGPRPIVVSYGSSPVAEVLYAATPMDEPPTAAVVADGTCFRQIEFAGILSGTPNRALAEAWIDFMLSPLFQEDMPLQMFVFPANPEAQLDPLFREFLTMPDRPVTVDAAEIETNREKWINAWREVVLR